MEPLSLQAAEKRKRSRKNEQNAKAQAREVQGARPAKKQKRSEAVPATAQTGSDRPTGNVYDVYCISGCGRQWATQCPHKCCKACCPGPCTKHKLRRKRESNSAEMEES
ncbi:hypothetical protein P389DRAFT_168672 [Cystobasidium minutum MCA 4210]|uniref:uncharacterized protein n=1 Tax=Cystobasidium minutum MCA 4210 TaxID=1397322 RepID=UPI0034CD59A9|eukprot:jgi/Rhomi1/168672/fgenesh1_kg.3_\